MPRHMARQEVMLGQVVQMVLTDGLGPKGVTDGLMNEMLRSP